MNTEHDLAPAQTGSQPFVHEEILRGVEPKDDRVSNIIEVATERDIRSLSNYRDGVDSLLRLRSDKTISNSFPAHAAILFEKFFEYARNHVRIFSHELNPEVFGGSAVVSMARWAVGKHNVRVSVITQATPKDSEFLKFLESKELGVSLIVAQDQKTRDLSNNFAVMDDAAVRVETDLVKCKATAVMHKPDLAQQWSRYFDKILLTEQMKVTIQGSI